MNSPLAATRTPTRLALAALATILASLPAVSYGASVGSACAVTVLTNGRVHARFLRCPIDRAVHSLSAAIGLGAHWIGPPGSESVSLEIDDLDPGVSIARLLSHRNFTLVSEAGNPAGVMRLWIGSARDRDAPERRDRAGPSLGGRRAGGREHPCRGRSRSGRDRSPGCHCYDGARRRGATPSHRTTGRRGRR